MDEIFMPFALVHIRIFISEKCGLLVCNGVQFGESSTFRSNIYPPSSGSKGKQETGEIGGKMSLPRIKL